MGMAILALPWGKMANAPFGQNALKCVETLRPVVNDVRQSENNMEDPKLDFVPLDEIPDHSFIILRVDVPGPMEKLQAADSIVGGLNQYKDIFKRKHLTFMIMTPKESLDILTEAEMNQAGWYRKNQ